MYDENNFDLKYTGKESLNNKHIYSILLILKYKFKMVS